jgi:hypothetical protein
LSPIEVQVLAGLSPSADFLEIYGAAMIDVQQMFNERTGGENMADVAEGLDERDWENDESKKPWLNPHRLFAAGGLMMVETAQAIRDAEHSLETSASQAQAETDKSGALASQLEDLGVENRDGVLANHFGYSGLNEPMGSFDGTQATLNGASIWIDAERDLILGHRIEGTMVAEGQSRPFFIEVSNSDFRGSAGCDLYEPHRRVTRMGGMLDDAQMAQMEEARVQLEEFDRQMAAMPADQREMMENMMGKQMDMVRSLASGGAMEYVDEIEEILCDPDLKELFSVPGAPAGGVLPTSADLLRQIQEHLLTLGYKPGNTDGVLDTMTEVAISQFQAENGLPVTGEPSAQLSGALDAEVDRQGLG